MVAYRLAGVSKILTDCVLLGSSVILRFAQYDELVDGKMRQTLTIKKLLWLLFYI